MSSNNTIDISAVRDKEVSYWLTEINKCKTIREPFERQWYLNLAFFKGKQYAVWLPQNQPLISQKLTEPPAPSYRVRLVCNKIKPIVRREITKLTKEEPQFFVRPNTPEPQDISGARIGEIITQYLMDDLEFNVYRRQAAFWLSVCGIGYLKATVQGEDNELDLAAPSPFHILVPNAEEMNIQKQPYVIHSRGISKEDLFDAYGVMLADSDSGKNDNMELKFLNAIGVRDTYSSAKGMVFAHEIWVKPCKNYPYGGMIVIADNQLVYAYSPVEDVTNTRNEKGFSNTTFPYEHGEFPFAKQEHIPSGGYYTTSVVDDLIPLQMEYNRTRSQLVEAKNRMGKPGYTYIKGALDPTKMTSKPGILIPINPGFEPPRLLENPPPNPMAMTEVDLISRDIDESASQNEIAKGRTPPGIEAASAIAYLQEENDSILHITIASIEQSTAQIGRQLLQLVQEFWDEEKITKVVSKNSAFEAIQFKSLDIKNNTDLRVEPGSMAPRSKAARQAFLTEWIKLGIITPEQGLKYLEMSETNQLWDELQMDAKAAQRENRMMSMQAPSPVTQPVESQDPTTGQPITIQQDVIDPETGQPQMQVHNINPWDNTDVHILEHRKYLVSQEYEMLDPAIKEAILHHYTLHQQAKLSEGILNAAPGSTPGSTANPGANSPA